MAKKSTTTDSYVRDLEQRHQDALEKIVRLQGTADKVTDSLTEARRELTAAKQQPQIRVLRLVEYAGNRAAVEDQIRQSIHGTVEARRGEVLITAVTLHEYPDVLKVARMAPAVQVDSSDLHDKTEPVRGGHGGNRL